jgi:RNA polymerase sigma-70 factor (ECF subfamily)
VYRHESSTALHHVSDFDAFYQRSYVRTFRTIRMLCASSAEAEDAVAEAYARALARWDEVGGMDLPEAWVRRVAMNQATDQHRSRMRERLAWPRFGAPVPQAGPEDADPTDLVVALRRLPPRQRHVLVLYYIADRSVADIAAELSLPAGTVKAHLSRGRGRLAALLRPDLEVLHEH